MDKHAEKLTEIAEFFKQHELPPELMQKTKEYISALWTRSVSRGINQRKLLGVLPRHVQRDILVASHM